MAKKTNRRFYRYRLQAHEPSARYDDLFAALQRVRRPQRLARVGNLRIFIEDVSRIDTGLMLRCLAIRNETDYTTFDLGDFTTSDTSLPEGKRFAVAAHALFVIGTREFIYEYVRGGPKVDDTIAAIQYVLRHHTDFKQVRLEATPVIDENKFIQDVNRLERIRTVRIDVTEPNAAWTDWDDPLHELGEESGADHVSLEATARRAESLKKNKGIVQVLKQALRAPNSHVKKAVVQGRFPQEPTDKTLRTDKEQRFDTRQVSVDSGGSTNIVSASAALDSIGKSVVGE